MLKCARIKYKIFLKLLTFPPFYLNIFICKITRRIIFCKKNHINFEKKILKKMTVTFMTLKINLFKN